MRSLGWPLIIIGLPRCLQRRRHRFDPWVGKIPWRRAWHSSILAWRIPWPEEPGRLQSIESQRVWHNSSDLACSLQIVTDLSLLFPFGLSISFPFLFALPRISKPILNKSGENVHPWLKCFQLFIFWCDNIYGFIIYGLYYFEVCSLCAYILERFLFFIFLIINGCWA